MIICNLTDTANDNAYILYTKHVKSSKLNDFKVLQVLIIMYGHYILNKKHLYAQLQEKSINLIWLLSLKYIIKYI